MSAISRQQRLAKYAAVAIAAWCMVEALGAVDESVFGIYSGQCTLNGEPMRVALEIVRNEGSQNGGDALLTISKNGEASSVTRVTMRGGYRDVRQPRPRGDHSPPETRRQFDFSALDVSEAFGGFFRVQLTQEDSQLKGTLSFAPALTRHRRDQPAVEPAQPASVPLVLTRSSMTTSESPPTASPESPALLKPEEITGLYEGTLTSNKRQFFARLRLNRERANDLSGLLDFSATASDARPLGSFKLTGKFDAANNRFQLSSGGELTSSDGLILATANGNFDPAKGEIRAQLTPNNGILELTRNREKTVALQAKTAEDMKRLSQGPVSLAKAKTEQERRDVIIRWFSRLKAEYPDIDLHHTVLNQIFPKVLNLFGDDAFVPVFGKPFDEMTTDDRNYVKLMFRRLFTGPQTRNLLDGFGDELERPFILPHGSFSFADVAPQLAFRRAVRKQWHEAMDRLKTLAAASADYDELLALEKKGNEPFHDLWPSEFKQFEEGVESTKHRIADGAATERLNTALANTSGVDGARSLSGWAGQEKDLLKYVSGDARQKLNSRVNAKLDELLEGLLRGEADAVSKFGQGMEAVQAGNKWYHHLTETFGFAAGRPAFQAAVEKLKARRSADLAAAQSAIITEVINQSSERAVDGVRWAYLSVPGDTDTPVAAAVADAASTRKKAIQREQALARFSPHEQEWLTPAGTIAVPSEVPEPDENDLRVAIVRTLEMMGGERVDAFTVNWANPITKRLGTYPIITIDNVEKLACERVPGGFRVNYRVHMTIDYPETVKRMMNSQPSFGGMMMQQLTQQINGPHGTQEGHFELTEHGWWCPTMQEHGLLSGHEDSD
jgi:hypothetical protein